jgi:hypothetical protein
MITARIMYRGGSMNIHRVLVLLLIAAVCLVCVGVGAASDMDITLEGSYDIEGVAYGVTVSDNYAYVADGYGGLVIIDISNPAVPTLVGSYDISGAYDVKVSGSYAYVAGCSDGLVIVDISNPATPAFIGSYNTAGNAYDVEVSGNYAYVADYDNGLVIVDISNPTSPIFKSNCNTGDNFYSITVLDNHAYVLDGTELIIIDVSNPESPTCIGDYQLDGNIYGVEVRDGYAYVSFIKFTGEPHESIKGLEVIDISNPNAPYLVGRYVEDGRRYYTTGRITYGITLSGNYAYVTNGHLADVTIFDISTPSLPKLAGYFATPGLAMNIAIKDNYAYVADYWEGFNIWHISTSGADIISPTLIITSPISDPTVTTPTITVSGTATDDTGVTILTVNGNAVTVESDGSFTTTVSLTNGMNTITVVATDAASNTATQSITVTYTPSSIIGDLNGNDLLDTGDVTLVLRMAVGLVTQDLLGDMNSNGFLDTGDATLILRTIVELE